MNPTSPTGVQNDGSRRLWRRILPPVLLVAAIAAAYSNSFGGAFLFDDVYHIVENERIRQLWPPWDLLAVERPVVEVSLAFNYALGGLNPWGYHAFNLIVHTLATLTLFGVVRRTIVEIATEPRSHEATKGIDTATVLRPSMGAEGISAGTHPVTGLAPGALLALVLALLWAIHPLQTQSVTYIIQRGESLMGLFYLLTLYCAIRGLCSPRRFGWYAGAVVACGLGMASKAVMVTAPIMVILYNFVFGRGQKVKDLGSRGLPTSSGQVPPSARWGLYWGLAATWSVLWLCGVTGEVLDPEARRSHVGFGYQGITPLEYALTQLGVILNYLRLALWPVELCLDYDWPIASSLNVIVLPTVIIVGLLIATGRELVRRSWLGFAGAWFFIILAPTSSFIPIKDPAFEHRMYLPLAAVIAVALFGGRALFDAVFARLSTSLFVARGIKGAATAAVAMLLVYGTYQRNKDYQSDLAMWADVAARRPHSARARIALGNALLERNRVDEAIGAYRESVAIRPDFAEGHCALGMGLARKGVLDEAVTAYRESMRLDPNFAKAHYNLANALSRQAKLDEAVQSYRDGLLIQPQFADAHCNLGNALARQGLFEEAMVEFREAIRIKPELANAHNNLGDVLRQLGRMDEAIAEFREAIRIQPNYANAHANLAAAHLDRGEYEAAEKYAREALRFDPGHSAATEIMTEVQAALSARGGP